MDKFLQCKKTYIGLFIALAGAVGLFKYVSEGELTTFLNVGAELVGLGFAAYGRFNAKPK